MSDEPFLCLLATTLYHGGVCIPAVMAEVLPATYMHFASARVDIASLNLQLSRILRTVKIFQLQELVIEDRFNLRKNAITFW